MHKFSYIYLLLFAFVMVQCTPKTTEAVVVEEETVNNVAEEAWRSQAPEPAEARSIELGDYSSFDLENGLKVIVVENHKLPRISYQLSLINDPVLERDQVGIVSMAGQLMKQGTKNRTKSEIDEAVDFIGARLNTSGSGIYASSLKKHTDELLNIMTDVLYNPTFPEEEFDKNIVQLKSGLAAAKSDPNSIISNVAAVVNYGKNHPYGEVQTEEIVENLKLEEAKKYYNNYYKPNNAYLIIVGDITVDEAKSKAEKYFSEWTPGDIPSSSYEQPEGPDERRVIIANKDGAVQSVINITYPLELKPGSDDAIKARVMNSILGGGIFSGRLMQNLREDKAYTYGARSNLDIDQTVGNFTAYASVRNAVTDSSVHEFLYEMERLVEEPVSAEDLQKVKNSMSGSFARSLESPQTIARFAYNTYRYNLPKDYYNNYLKMLESVTIEDVQEMAQKYVRPDNANIIIVGSADDISESLKRFDADGKIEYYGPFGDKIERKEANTDMSGIDIVKNHITALGGKDKLMGVNDLTTEISMSVMGQDATVITLQKKPNKFSSKTVVGGNVMQEQKYDGMKGYMGGMGGSQTVTDPEQLKSFEEQAQMFSELSLLNDDYTLTVKGMEAVDGVETYKVEAEKDGEKRFYFFDKETNLLKRISYTTEGPQGNSMTITTDHADYKPVDGILMPHKITVTGAMPFPLEMNVTTYKVNSGINDSEFIIE